MLRISLDDALAAAPSSAPADAASEGMSPVVRQRVGELMQRRAQKLGKTPEDVSAASGLKLRMVNFVYKGSARDDAAYQTVGRVLDYPLAHALERLEELKRAPTGAGAGVVRRRNGTTEQLVALELRGPLGAFLQEKVDAHERDVAFLARDQNTTSARFKSVFTGEAQAWEDYATVARSVGFETLELAITDYERESTPLVEEPAPEPKRRKTRAPKKEPKPKAQGLDHAVFSKLKDHARSLDMTPEAFVLAAISGATGSGAASIDVDALATTLEHRLSAILDAKWGDTAPASGSPEGATHTSIRPSATFRHSGTIYALTEQGHAYALGDTGWNRASEYDLG